MKASEALKRALLRLQGAGVPDARAEAEWLVADALLTERGRLRLRLDQEIPPDALMRLDEWLDRRASGEPLQYIEGFADFMGYRFRVDRRVLIPRQDTEALCEWALDAMPRDRAVTVLDLCTGSGALAIAIKKERPRAAVTASDISPEALSLARENARRLDAEIEWLTGDLFAPASGRRFDVIVCNPPYIRTADMDALQREVRFEPELALLGGEDGLDFYRRIARALRAHMADGGSAYFEVGYDQAGDVSDLLTAANSAFKTEIQCDISGVQRVVRVKIG